MINLMIKSIFENSSRIDSVIKCVDKTNKKYCLMFGMIALETYIMTKVITNNRNRIIELENEIKEMKSKGE